MMDLKKLADGWDVSSYAACMVFSDYLIEKGHIKEANLIRWFAHCKFIDFTIWSEWNNLYPTFDKWSKTELPYREWKYFAQSQGYEVLKDDY